MKRKIQIVMESEYEKLFLTALEIETLIYAEMEKRALKIGIECEDETFDVLASPGYNFLV